MKTSQLTRRMMLPALFLGLAGFAQAAPNQTQHYGGKPYRIRIIPAVNQSGGWTIVRTAVRDGRGYKRLPTVKLNRHRPVATAKRHDGRSKYLLTAKMFRSKVYLKVLKYKGKRLVAYGALTVPIRKTPPPATTTTYSVSRYHPLTGKHIHTQVFVKRTAALNWYNHNKKQWWLFVYSDFGRKPLSEGRGSRAVCTKAAKAYNANLFDGKRAKAMPPRITFKTSRR